MVLAEDLPTRLVEPVQAPQHFALARGTPAFEDGVQRAFLELRMGRIQSRYQHAHCGLIPSFRKQL
jgi:hypothetical protein